MPTPGDLRSASDQCRFAAVTAKRSLMALEHSNLDGAKQYAGGSEASAENLQWNELRYRTAEEAVRKSEAILRAVTENTPDWLFLLDETLHVRFMNRPFGPNRPDVVLGQAFLDFVPQELRPNMEEIYRRGARP